MNRNNLNELIILAIFLLVFIISTDNRLDRLEQTYNLHYEHNHE